MIILNIIVILLYFTSFILLYPIMSKKYTIQIQKDKNGMFVGEVIGLPACYTQAKTIPQLLERIVEVSEWSLELLSFCWK